AALERRGVMPVELVLASSPVESLAPPAALSAQAWAWRVRESGQQPALSRRQRRQGSDKKRVSWAVSRQVSKGKSVSTATRPVSTFVLRYHLATQSRQKHGSSPFELRRSSG